MTDENPSTNPPGEFGIHGVNRYYPWLECHMDDSYSFLTDQLSINNNETACDDGLDLIFNTKALSYSYDVEFHILRVGNGDDVAVFNVYELNKDRLKLGLSVPASGGGNMVFFYLRGSNLT